MRSLLALLAAFAADAGSTASQRGVIFVSSDLRGYLGPCGCSENMRGGLPRAAHQLAEARAQGAKVLFFDAGDSLFGTDRLAPEAAPQQSRKAQALAQGMKLMGLDARAVGEKDDARGESFRRSLKLPEIARGTFQLFEAAGRRIGVVSGADAAELSAPAKQAREAGARFVLALFHGTFDAAQKAAADPAVAVDLIVPSHAAREIDGEDNRLARGRIPVAQVQSKGRSLLRIDLSFSATPGDMQLVSTTDDVTREVKALEERIGLLDKQINAPGLPEEAKKLRQQKLAELIDRREALAAASPPGLEGRNAFSARFVPLEATLPSDEKTRAIVLAYDRDVGKLNLAWAKKHGKDCPKPRRGEAAFVGNESCRECHEDAFPVWDKSLHAHAYETLEELGKQFHLDCIGCHVTGFRKPGGVCRVDKVARRQDVGCESCHGPGSVHNEDPTSDNISLGNTESACIGCHDPENSPHFDFATYLPQILGPGHGEKRAGK